VADAVVQILGDQEASRELIDYFFHVRQGSSDARCILPYFRCVCDILLAKQCDFSCLLLCISSLLRDTLLCFQPRSSSKMVSLNCCYLRHD
jgi:hypothetical protein